MLADEDMAKTGCGPTIFVWEDSPSGRVRLVHSGALKESRPLPADEGFRSILLSDKHAFGIARAETRPARRRSDDTEADDQHCPAARFRYR